MWLWDALKPRSSVRRVSEVGFSSRVGGGGVAATLTEVALQQTEVALQLLCLACFCFCQWLAAGPLILTCCALLAWLRWFDVDTKRILTMCIPLVLVACTASSYPDAVARHAWQGPQQQVSRQGTRARRQDWQGRTCQVRLTATALVASVFRTGSCA